MSMILHRGNNVFPKTFNDFFWAPATGGYEGNKLLSTPVDILEGETEYQMLIDLPGVKKDDITLKIEDGILTIGAERQETSIAENQHMTRREISYGTFTRSFTLGKQVETKGIEAQLNDGVLKLTLPKKEKQTVNISVG